MMQLRNSGITPVGDIPWGSHFCQFYRTQADLIEILVPYFEAGLRLNESCLWITSDALSAEAAEDLMCNALPDFKSILRSGQMQIVPISEWYTAGDSFDANAILDAWIAREQEAKARGFSGLRLTGDTIWVERSGWNDFMEYENKVNNTFRHFNLIALCTYCLNKCTAEDVIQVCCHHEFALARRHGKWDLLESSSLKMAKEELRELNLELESRVNTRTTELNAALSARDQFLAMLGHELRNPLGSIRNATEIICRQTTDDSPITAITHILDRQVRHMTRLIDDLLDVGRITRGHIQLQREVLSITDAVEQAIEITRPLIDQHGHTLSLNLPDHAVYVLGDRTRLAQVFGNLLHNAAKYTKNKGKIGVDIKSDDEYVSISVSDTGAGIPADKLSAIFDLFTQLPRSLERSEGGLGIGLTLVQRITEMHEGTVTAVSEGPDKGSTFTVKLKRAPSNLINEKGQSAIPSSVLVPRKVLVIDDSVDNNETISTFLHLAGHHVSSALNGPDGIEISKCVMPDVVLLDIGLPEMDGYEVARDLRKTHQNHSMKIIAVTGYGQAADLKAATDAGCDAHLLKPADPQKLLNLISSLTAQ